MGWKYVADVGLLKGWLAFSYLIFQGLSFLHLEITICKKIFFFFFATIILEKKGHSQLSENELENIP